MSYSSKIGKLKIHSWPYLNNSVVTGGSAVINTKNWVIELNGQHELFGPNTQIRIRDFWMPASYNPGLHARNRYGHAIYKHVQHWITLGNASSSFTF